MNGGAQRLPASCRIRERGDFKRVERLGARASGAHFVVFVRSRTGVTSRLGVTVSRRVGGAVLRNRVKRLVREVFRRERAVISGADTVVIARTGAGALSFCDVSSELTRLWLRASEAGREASRA